MMCGTGSAARSRWITVPSGCCSSQAWRKAAATERDEDASPGSTDESMCSSVAMGLLQEGRTT
ncbi:hypothetical protein AQJ67_37475 [Streptomyces caeruleatus]|uniref:Uncharacterized protein n=1 Tax=Streptomyces caeruleatus TaxID=661399 RepID=A0A101TKM5_9ACTN|nr:hypothetical protein AQJ67_37475 [Streptomyces caeruleatus]